MRQVLIVGCSLLFLAGCGGAGTTLDGGEQPTGGGTGGGSVATGGGTGTGGGISATGGGTASTGGGAGGGAAATCTTCHAMAALATGSHQAHLAEGSVSGGFDCATCHVLPTDSTHAAQPVSITFDALSKTGGLTPAYDAASHTCSSVYCHGSAATTPAWSTTAAKLSCAGCHGDPPTSSWHASVAAGPASCNTCHGWTVDPAGKILLARGVPSLEFGARHLDGIAEGHHPWTSSHPQGHPASIDVALCNGCHRQQVADPYKVETLPTGTISVCTQCH